MFGKRFVLPLVAISVGSAISWGGTETGRTAWGGEFPERIQQRINSQREGAESEAEGIQNLSPAALEVLVAGIALYPNPLVEQILEASQHPGQIHRVAQPAGSERNGFEERIPTASSVAALEAYPEILQQLDAHLGLTTRLGLAYRNQPEDVWRAIERVREKIEAAANGTGEGDSTGGVAVPQGYAAGTAWVMRRLYAPAAVAAIYGVPGATTTTDTTTTSSTSTATGTNGSGTVTSTTTTGSAGATVTESSGSGTATGPLGGTATTTGNSTTVTGPGGAVTAKGGVPRRLTQDRTERPRHRTRRVRAWCIRTGTLLRERGPSKPP